MRITPTCRCCGEPVPYFGAWHDGEEHDDSLGQIERADRARLTDRMEDTCTPDTL